MDHQPYERQVTDDSGMMHGKTLATDGMKEESALISTQLTSLHCRPYNKFKEKKHWYSQWERKNTGISH